MRIPVQDNTTGYIMYARSITDRALIIFQPCPCNKCTLTFGQFLKLYPVGYPFGGTFVRYR